MLFNSYIFICLFLPFSLLIFYTLTRIGKATAALFSLVAASLLFYGWWNPVYLVLLLFSVLVNYTIGSRIGKLRKQQQTQPARLVLYTGIVFNVALLGYFKYTNFFVDSLNYTFDSSIYVAPIVLPLAISFFTFQQIAYLADVHAGKAEEYDLLRYMLFVTFFPQLIAGPIVHHQEMMPEFRSEKLGKALTSNLAIGSAIFFLGLFKKVLLADNVAPYANAVFYAAKVGDPISFSEAWLGCFAYTLQIYFDFSGYSDMAIGLGRMFGIKIPLNFNSPFKSTGIIDLWQRWHMTLSRFLRDYIYIPLGGNRLGSTRRYTNMMLVMLIGGLWHGAGWNYVIWGGLNGCYLMINHAWRHWRGDRLSNAWPNRFFSGCLTFVAFATSVVFFHADSTAAAVAIVGTMAGFNGISVPEWLATLPSLGAVIGALPIDIVVAEHAPRIGVLWVAGLLMIACLFPNTQQIMHNYLDKGYYRIFPFQPAVLCWRPTIPAAIGMAFLTVCTFFSLERPSEFIYFQF